jgi:membrane protein
MNGNPKNKNNVYSFLPQAKLNDRVPGSLQLLHQISAYFRSFLRSFLRYCNWSTIVYTIRGARKQRLAGLAAEIAYNATLSFFPAILALLAALSFFDLSHPELQNLRPAFRELASRFAEVTPGDVVGLVRGFVEHGGGEGIFTLSFAMTLWVSSSAMAATMAALDQIQQTPFRSRRPFWRARLVALILTLGNILLYMLAALLIFVSNFAIDYLAGQVGPMGTRLLALWQMLNWPIALGLIAIAVTCLYRFGPSRRPISNPIIPGALLASLSWAGFSLLFKAYLLQFGTYRQVYGSTLGTAIIFMLWLYLSALVILVGYQLNVTIAQKIGRPNAITGGLKLKGSRSQWRSANPWSKEDGTKLYPSKETQGRKRFLTERQSSTIVTRFSNATPKTNYYLSGMQSKTYITLPAYNSKADL